MPGPLSTYPRVHLIKDATLFFTTPLAGVSVRWNTASFAWSVVCPGPGVEYDSFGVTSVLLPLLPEFGYRTRLLMCGSNVAKLIDLDDAVAVVATDAAAHAAREWGAAYPHQPQRGVAPDLGGRGVRRVSRYHSRPDCRRASD